MRKYILAAGLLAAGLSLSSCSTTRYAKLPERAKPAATPMPRWLKYNKTSEKKVCGIGVAGRSIFANSDKAKELSLERALQNLTGVFETKVYVALIVDTESNTSGFYHDRVSTQYEQNISVAEDLMLKVIDYVKPDFWYDVDGEGPFNQEGFTYARACVDFSTLTNVGGVDGKKLQKLHGTSPSMDPTHVPVWINRYGRFGDRLCAVGYADPRFYAEEALSQVVNNVRSQLTASASVWVSSYLERNSSGNQTITRSLQTALLDDISRGVVVNSFWYDRDGIGTLKKKKVTYGWGCIYPVAALASSAKAVKEKYPQAVQSVEAVREHAQAAFEALDDAIDSYEEDAAAESQDSVESDSSVDVPTAAESQDSVESDSSMDVPAAAPEAAVVSETPADEVPVTVDGNSDGVTD